MLQYKKIYFPFSILRKVFGRGREQQYVGNDCTASEQVWGFSTYLGVSKALQRVWGACDTDRPQNVENR